MITEEQKQILKFVKPSLGMTLIFSILYHFRYAKRCILKVCFPFKERHCERKNRNWEGREDRERS